MNKFVLVLLFSLCSSLSFAGSVQPIPSDNSPYTAVCLAALESETALHKELQKQGIAESELYNVTCNGDYLTKFASKYQNSQATHQAPKRVFAVNGAETEAASICIAAATSNQAFSRLKDELLNPFEQASLYNVECNGESLTRFARSYGNPEFKI